MTIYLDHAATTPLSEAVKRVIVNNFDNYGNPSSMHRLGVNVEKNLKESRRVICDALKINERELIFTSGGTESNNLAIFGSVSSRLKGRYITSRIEHPSVLNAFERLEKMGHDVVYISVDEEGKVNLDELESALNVDTILVSIMAVNNEIGRLQPIHKIGEMIFDFNKNHKTNIRFHVDAVQAFGKFPISIEKSHIDMMSISAHKINGLKGTGALICKNINQLKPIMVGGQQEFSIRPGTENVLGILAFGEAVKGSYETMTERFAHVQKLKSTLLDRFSSDSEIVLNGKDDDDFSPYVLNASFLGVKGEVLLHTLEMKGVYIATGSACSSKKKTHSHVLKALHYNEKRLNGAIRISFGKESTLIEIEEAASIIMNSASELRKIINKTRR